MILVLGFIEWIQDPGYGIADLVLVGLTELPIGAVVGAAVGFGAVAAFERASFATPGLYPVASIATAGIAFGLADVLHGSGFLAVYLAGLALGSARIPGKRTVEDFHAGVAWVAQIALFLTLGLLVFPSELGDVAVDGLILTAVLLLVARPVAAYVATRIGALHRAGGGPDQLGGAARSPARGLRDLPGASRASPAPIASSTSCSSWC